MNEVSKLFESRACLSQEELRAYLQNELDEDQRFSIEDHLLDCELCQAAVDGLALADPTLSQAHLQEIRQAIPQLTGDRGSVQPEVRLRRIRPWQAWAVAAAAIGLLILSGLLYKNLGPIDNEQLYAQVYTPYESPFAGTRSGGTEDEKLGLGLDAYQNQDYPQALSYFEEVLKASPEQSLAHFHAGLACMQLNRYEEAKSYMSTSRINAPVLYGPASWYLALAQLRLGQVDDCRATLQQISSEESGYYAEAQELLKQLNRLAE